MPLWPLFWLPCIKCFIYIYTFKCLEIAHKNWKVIAYGFSFKIWNSWRDQEETLDLSLNPLSISYMSHVLSENMFLIWSSIFTSVYEGVRSYVDDTLIMFILLHSVCYEQCILRRTGIHPNIVDSQVYKEFLYSFRCCWVFCLVTLCCVWCSPVCLCYIYLFIY